MTRHDYQDMSAGYQAPAATTYHGPCPHEGCTLALVVLAGITLAPICPAHGATDDEAVR